MMRSNRFMLPFTLGAASMLVLAAAVEWGAPGVLGRVSSALRPEATPSAAPSVLPPAAPGPESVDSLPFPGVVPADPAAEAPPVAAAPPEAGPDDGGLLIPVQGVKASSLVNTYDDARGQGRRHDAIDIMAARGTPVVAVADGVVMKLFQSERGGITLYELAPDRRTIYYYAHLDRYAPGIAEGQPLRRGQLLGYVGNTGDAGPGNYHLHFEVSTTADPKKYWGGTPQNPYPLLQ
jgi:murein DD-endopeptidase MepM/ murein hydrolase activator NlpD